MDSLFFYKNPNFNTFIVLKQTQLVKQIDWNRFEKINKFVTLGDLCDGIFVKKDNKIYIDLGVNKILGFNVFIPVVKMDETNDNIITYMDYLQRAKSKTKNKLK